ncbi:MAG: restriction endonuclease subunit S [Rhodospirillaceae bacterium]
MAGVNRVSEETYRAWTKRAVPEAGDLIIAREAPVGNVAIIPPGVRVCLGQRTVLVRPDKKQVDPLYLCYFLLGDYAQHKFRGASVGATVAHLNMKDIRGLPMPTLPPLPAQRCIASVLGAYDDLIEVNRRRIAVLEEMARGLFEEWFVRFRFPGHEAVPILDTQDGPLPEGWNWTPLAKLAKFKSGNNKLTKAAYKEKGVTAYSASGPDGFVEKAEGYGPAVIVGAVGAYCGKSWLADGEWTAIANTFALLPNHGVPAEFLFLAMCGIEKWPRRGAAQPFIAKTDAGAKKLPHPPQEIWSSFAQHVEPIFGLINALGASNRNLTASRDLLLPRLISGQLSIAEAERELEVAA